MTAEHAEGSPAAHPAPSALRAVRPDDRRCALGMAVSYLMKEPVFARLPFGQWSRVLVGQVNRGHCLFAMRGERVVGFAGWAITTRDRAEAWLTRNRDFSSAEGRSGDVMLINAWMADDPVVNRFLVRVVRRAALQDKVAIYAKRFYQDGRVRPVRLSVGEFVRTGRSDETHPRLT